MLRKFIMKKFFLLLAFLSSVAHASDSDSESEGVVLNRSSVVFEAASQDPQNDDAAPPAAGQLVVADAADETPDLISQIASLGQFGRIIYCLDDDSIRTLATVRNRCLTGEFIRYVDNIKRIAAEPEGLNKLTTAQLILANALALPLLELVHQGLPDVAVEMMHGIFRAAIAPPVSNINLMNTFYFRADLLSEIQAHLRGQLEGGQNHYGLSTGHKDAPACIGSLKFLRFISLSPSNPGMESMQLPWWINRLEHLEDLTLTVSRSGMSADPAEPCVVQLPEVLGKLTRLRSLRFTPVIYVFPNEDPAAQPIMIRRQMNVAYKLPSNFHNLKNLQNLTFEDSLSLELDDKTQLPPSLKIVRLLSHNPAQGIPQCLKSLDNLQELYIGVDNHNFAPAMRAEQMTNALRRMREENLRGMTEQMRLDPTTDFSRAFPPGTDMVAVLTQMLPEGADLTPFLPRPKDSNE
jgi:hypothetical protein